jgi:hypothetical protein
MQQLLFPTDSSLVKHLLGRFLKLASSLLLLLGGGTRSSDVHVRGLGGSCLSRSFFFFVGGFLSNDSQHLGLQAFFILRKSVLLPGIVHNFRVKVVSRKAVFEQSNALFVVGLLFEFKGAAVLHELFEFSRVTLA